jgi:cell surface protein SprA
MYRKYTSFLMFFSILVSAQVKPISQDTIQNKYDLGKIKIPTPKSILSAYEYDPILDLYIYTNSVEGFNIKYPLFLTPLEYQNLIQKASIHNYFKEKGEVIEAKKNNSQLAQKDLLPRYYIKSGFFQTIFGSNTIDLKPTGSVEMDLGVRYTKQDNPSFSPRNRSSLAFDFDQKISMSLIGNVGTRLSVNINYDTESTFDFQNSLKLAYDPSAGLDEDGIIKKIEVGNISMPINNSLITGAQNLFGVKTELQFGKTSVTGVFSQQKSETKTITAQGSESVQDFSMYALDYDGNRHFFLSQYFRNKYDASLKKYPLIDSRVQISRIEVWVTNKQSQVSTTTNNLRNIIALQDLGEASLTGLLDNQVVVLDPSTGMFNNAVNSPSDNSNNDYDPAQIKLGTGLLNSNIREIATSTTGFNVTVAEGQDYSKLENARKLNATEYTLNKQLGYISLKQKLTSDQVLAVAYEYTIGDKTYRVGEFASDVDATVVSESETISTQCLILKMLKSSLVNVKNPVWNLMMKNVYQIPSAYQINQEDFKFNILYTNPSALNYISPVIPFPSNPTTENEVAEAPLLRVFNLDRLDASNDPLEGGDGYFDYVSGLTIDAENGRIIFTTKEPFGELIFKKLSNDASEDYNDVNTYNANQKKYVYRSMYSSTQTTATQDSDKNKFLLKGKYKSTGSDGISIGSFSAAQGSVVVSTGGRTLVDGIDYTVNYQLGKVYILDESLIASNADITVSVENNATFGQQTKSFIGLDINHAISDSFSIGATYLRYSEKPYTQKSVYGQESVDNTIFGLNTSFSSEVPFFTRLINKLPNIDTDVPSSISVRGEVAYLKPNTSKASDFDGESTVYIDDFESSAATIDLTSASSWHISSTPASNSSSNYDFNESATDLSYGFKRAKLAWYAIDPVFYTSKPSGISDDEISLNTTRRIYKEELYPNVDIETGQTTVVNTLDLSYYPSERGAYNNGLNFASNPKNNFGGITRAISTTDFEQSNVEYIQIWLLDPYVGNDNMSQQNTGKIYFNLGEISEDILKDGRKQYENGLGSDQIMVTPQSVWGDVPASQSLTYTFDTDTNNRSDQDIGLDGLKNNQEALVYNNYGSEIDPAADDYTYYLNTTGSVLDRYKNYNGTDGNSKVDANDSNRGSTTLPDVEDLNGDYTMNTVNAYYEYSIDIKPNMEIGKNYISDIRDTQVTLANGNVTQARWIQFKIPISQPENTIGSISDFASIRFMRMFITGFSEAVTIRFGALEFQQGTWRRYTNSLDYKDKDVSDDNTELDVLTINIEENDGKCPVNYVVPPGVEREQVYSGNSMVYQNEQSLGLKVSGKGLEPNDARAVYKSVNLDMRQYKKLKMFLHAESLTNQIALEDDQMTGFIRLGNDNDENFYQIEIPLKVTKSSNCSLLSSEIVWPEENEMDLSLELLTKLKLIYRKIPEDNLPVDGIYYLDEDDESLDPSLKNKTNRLRLGVKGSPNLGLVRVLMIGIKNNEVSQDIKGEVWFNELRLAEMDSSGGMAATLNLDSNFADFATVSATGKMSTSGFGGIEQSSTERSQDDTKQYNVLVNMSLGKLLPKKWGINLPFNYSVGEEIITPKYDPENPDITLKTMLENAETDQERASISNRAIDYTKNRSINFIGVRKERMPEQKQHVYDIENFTISESYNKILKHNYEIEDYSNEKTNTTINYAYNFQTKSITPFKKTKFMSKSNYWKLLSDFNFNLLPSNITFNSNINREYNQQQYRQVDVEGIAIDPLYKRNFKFNYQYGFNLDLTKSLKINYSATSINIVKNYLDSNGETMEDFKIWDDYFNIGKPNHHTQTMILNYEIPIYKVPILNFIKANISYTGNYDWQRASEALSEYTNEDTGITYDLGNTIQNSNSKSLNSNFAMETLYTYLGIVKKNKKSGFKSKKEILKPGQKITNSNNNQQPIQNKSFKDIFVQVLTSLKNIQVNYSENNETILPGFTQDVGFFGTSKPTLGFVFGSQEDIRNQAAKKGWLTNYQDFNQSFTQSQNKILRGTAKMEPFKDIKVDLSFNRSYSENFSEQFDISNGNYNSRSPYSTGSFSISTILVRTSFLNSDENSSEAFESFRKNRIVVARRLAIEKGINLNNPTNLDVDGYPIGFGKNSQAVLLSSFFAVYSGTPASNVALGVFKSFPLPNWNIKYTGLMNYDFFKNKFTRISIQHGYKATYSINSFQSSLKYTENPDGFDDNGNYFNKTILSNINLTEEFNPLIKMDCELKNSLKIGTEIKKNRTLSLSFDNDLLTETNAVQYIIGLGYRFKDVQFVSRLSDNPTGKLKGDINLKIDFSLNKNKTIVRYLDYDNNELTAGQNIWALKLTSDYALSKNITTTFYYNHSFSNPYVSTSYPITNIKTGFTLRYIFGN